jgi:hypothetical protein
MVFVWIACGSACTHFAPTNHTNLTIDLRWVQGYSKESRASVETGLIWGLSFLGAQIPQGRPFFSWHGNVVTVDLGGAGVPKESWPAWEKLLSLFKSSGEYRASGGLDIGRFLMLTLCSTNHYYALTGTSSTFNEFRSKHPFEPKRMAVVESTLTHGNRLVEIGKGDVGASRFGFAVYEGTGSIQDGSFQSSEIEALDFMPNGQLRFAVYDSDGNLKGTATPALSMAGKPSKCLWCHEIRLQSPFANKTDVQGYYSTGEFRAIIRDRMRSIDAYRHGLSSVVDFTKTQDHTFAELLYVSFAEPSAARLASEWNMPVEEVQRLLSNARTHTQSELRLLEGPLYRREEIDRFAPYTTIRVPSDAREASSYEPDLLK